MLSGFTLTLSACPVQLVGVADAFEDNAHRGLDGLKKKHAGSAPGFTWEHDGDVLDVPDELAQELLERPGDEFAEGEPPADGDASEEPESEGDQDADILGEDPLLAPLADNGGPTLTFAVLPGSPAVDAGNSSGCPATDQRGVKRPQGSACDIGAFEAPPIGLIVDSNARYLPFVRH